MVNERPALEAHCNCEFLFQPSQLLIQWVASLGMGVASLCILIALLVVGAGCLGEK